MKHAPGASHTTNRWYFTSAGDWWNRWHFISAGHLQRRHRVAGATSVRNRRRWAANIVFFMISSWAMSCFPPARPDLALQYKMAGLDASIASADEISYDLVAINRENRELTWDSSGKRILVVAIKSRTNYEKYYKNKTRTDASLKWVTKVTVAPQLKNFCQSYLQTHNEAGENELLLRIKQYLGINYEENHNTIFEMWVLPGDLFRPCVDPEIIDEHCELTFGAQTPRVKNIPDYRAFYQSLYYKSFRRMPQSPWTGLGYTYDWGSLTNRRGASEFMIVPRGRIEVVSASSPSGYCGSYDQRL